MKYAHIYFDSDGDLAVGSTYDYANEALEAVDPDETQVMLVAIADNENERSDVLHYERGWRGVAVGPNPAPEDVVP